MVLGLMDFLLGGKKKTKVPKTAQVATPATAQPVAQPQAATPGPDAGAGNLPDGANKPTENVEFVDSNAQKPAEQPAAAAQPAADAAAAQPGTQPAAEEKPAEQAAEAQPQAAATPAQPAAQPSAGGRKSVSEAINKLHEEIKTSNETMTSLVTDVKNIENTVTTIGHRIDDLEEGKKKTDDKISEIDESMTKFLSLYELINNQYNPFVDKDSMPQIEVPAKMPAVGADGKAVAAEGEASGEGTPAELSALKGPDGKMPINVAAAKMNDVDSALLELDTLNLDEAAGDAVPLTTLKNNTNSLVIILSWLEYLINRVGIDETRSSLRYYTEVLRWITPEVYFELDKYLRGMKDVEVEEGTVLSVRDHIVSLYFISKLNEKALDEKLTNAVLQIIKN